MESKLGIKQNRGLKRLTQLAFIFVPFSFVISVFGMNIEKLTSDGARWWTAIAGATIIHSRCNPASVDQSRSRQGLVCSPEI
jgi:Mg2+ and Co2+ transporter CorA